MPSQIALGETPSRPGRELPARLERETGIEPATNGLGSRYSTIELLPLQTELYLTPNIE